MKIAVEHFLTKQNINDGLFYSSLISELEEIIEGELSKDIDEMNAELIDDCCVAIENLQNILSGEETKADKAISGVENIINHHKKKLKSVFVAAVACAAVAVFCAITSFNLTNQNARGSLKFNSFLDNIFIYEQTVTDTESAQTTNAEKENTTFAGGEVTTIVSQPTENQLTEISPSVATRPVPHIYKITAIVPPGFKTEYTEISQIKLDDIGVMVYYSDNTVKTVRIDECDIKIGTPDEKGKTEITITYKSFDTSIYVNVKGEEKRNPVTLNSIYGIFEGGYSVEGMRVYAVYSDGTEKEISKGEYTVKREYSEDLEADVVIVEYNGCSFQFLPEN